MLGTVKTNSKVSQILSDYYPYFAVWVGPLVLIGSLIISGKVIFWGTAYLQFLPWHWAGWELISTGEFPLWSGYNGYGAPLLANYQSAFFYPPNILLWLFAWINGIRGLAVAQTLLVLLHLVLSGYGMLFLAKELGFTKQGQVVTAIAYSLSGYLVSRVSFLSMNAALTWMPWVLFNGLRIANFTSVKQLFSSRGSIYGIVIIALLLLSGHAQLAWYGLLIYFFWTVTWSIHLNGTRKIGLTIGIVVGTVLFAAGISAIQLLPTAEFLLQSQRASSVEFTYALNYSFWPWRFLTLISPNLFGNPANGNYWITADNFWEDNIYIGILPIVFSFVAIFRLSFGHFKGEPKKKVLVWFSIVFTVLSILFALGKNTPVFIFLYEYIPTFNMFQAPTRFSIWLVIFLALLAGLGVEKWTKPTGRWLYWSRLLAAGAVGITITSLMVWCFLRDVFQDTYIKGIVETGTLLSILLLLNLFLTRQRNDIEQIKSLQIFALVFLMADLVYSNWGVNPGMEINAINQKAVRSSGVDDQRLVYITPSAEENIKFQKFFRFDSFHPEDGWAALVNYFIPNSNVLGGYSSINNFDPLITARYEMFSNIIGHNLEENNPLFNSFWGVNDVVKDEQKYTPTIHLDETNRFRWFTCAKFTTSMEKSGVEVEKLIAHKAYTSIVVIENDPGYVSECSNTVSEINLLDYSNKALATSLLVEAETDGWLMQLSANYPGWTAYVDGREVDIYYGDIMFRTIPLSAGVHEIDFLYQSQVFKIGQIVSLIFSSLLFGYIILTVRYRKSNDSRIY